MKNKLNMGKWIKIISNEVKSDLPLQESSDEQLLILLAGFQGSGKTSVAVKLSADLNLINLSVDNIRQRMFDKGLLFSQDFVSIVTSVTHEVVVHSLKKGSSMILDTNITPKRMKNIKKLLNKNSLDKIHAFSVYLHADKEVLMDRVKNRIQVPTEYRGTVDELQASIKEYGEVNEKYYDLVIDTKINKIDQVVDEIKAALISVYGI